MKICFICGEYPPGQHGGIGTMTQVLGRSLAQQGHDVRVIGVYPSNYTAPDFENDRGVQVWRLRDSTQHGSWIAARYKLYRQVRAWIRAGLVDVVEVPDYQGWSAGWGRLDVPVVGRLHGSLTYFAAELHHPIAKIAYWLERASMRRLDYFSSVSAYTARKTQLVFNLPRNSDAILYNPVELPLDTPETPRAPKSVVFSGTLAGKKGIVSLIKAWPIVVQAHPDSVLHIFGKDGRAENGDSMRDFLSSQLNGTRRTVYFHGHVSREKLLGAYRTAGAAVFPSYAEAFAIAPLEAMAYGCATIYSTRGSGPELLEDGREGLLVDPDNPGDIAQAIVRILDNPSFAQQIGAAGRARIRQRFSVDALISENVAFYQQCIDAFPSRRGVR